ncbi:MAG: V-type ATPase subunit [Chloroflexi bacterium]|nr:V-type ATPase subunit [Chloroflexota bacterium]
MPDYDYGNARLHVMKSRLLARRELEALAEADGLDGLIAALVKTVYQKPVEAALTRTIGMPCIDEALRNDLVSTVGRIGGFYKESAGKMVAIILRAYDIHNLKAILRGLSKDVPAGDIIAILLPIGELSLSMLREFARLNTPREAIDLMASMRLSFARPLVNVRAEIPGAETFEMELALDKWYYNEARQILRSETGMTDALSYALTLEADLANVLTVLRFAHSPNESGLLRDKLGVDDPAHLFIGPGRISYEQLANAGRQDTVASAVETLSGTFFEAALRRGLEIYARSNRLSDIEKQLKQYRLQWLAGQFKRDPLGIGVVLGYIALKVNEIRNINWIAQGVGLGLKADAIRSELETVS